MAIERWEFSVSDYCDYFHLSKNGIGSVILEVDGEAFNCLLVSVCQSR